ncbi:hypothetical protein GQR58_009547 [Nymphon striatum]|nr:hypothetical protein GQR58_009547 [Nymphon striatum]
MNLVKINEKQMERVATVSVEDSFSDIFDGNLGKLPGLVGLKVDESVTPIISPSRRIPVSLRSELEIELSRLVKIGVLAPTEQHTPWVNQMVITEKRKVDMRISAAEGDMDADNCPDYDSGMDNCDFDSDNDGTQARKKQTTSERTESNKKAAAKYRMKKSSEDTFKNSESKRVEKIRKRRLQNMNEDEQTEYKRKAAERKRKSRGAKKLSNNANDAKTSEHTAPYKRVQSLGKAITNL